jgi:chromosomal replication initiation ATPase DnaA
MSLWPRWYSPPSARRVSDIIDAAARLTGYTVGQIAGQQRKRDICLVRFAVCIVARDKGHSYSAIGRRLGKRDHSSIIYAVERAEAFRQRDPRYAELIAQLKLECLGLGAVW